MVQTYKLQFDDQLTKADNLNTNLSGSRIFQSIVIPASCVLAECRQGEGMLKHTNFFIEANGLTEKTCVFEETPLRLQRNVFETSGSRILRSIVIPAACAPV